MIYYISPTETLQIYDTRSIMNVVIKYQPKYVAKVINKLNPYTYCYPNVDIEPLIVGLGEVIPTLRIIKDQFSNYKIFDKVNYYNWSQYFIFPQNLEVLYNQKWVVGIV